MATFEPKSALPDNVTDRGKVERIKLSGPGNSTEETEWVDVATQAELDAHTGDSSAAHAASAISFSATGSIAGTDVQTAVAEVATDAAAALSSHEADTTGVHGISDTSALLTTSSGIDALADVTITAAASGDILRHNGTAWVDAVGTTHFEAAGAVAAHEADTTSVHGIADTSALVTTSTALGGDLTGTVGNAQIAAGAVGATELASDAVTNAKVADDAIGIAELSATGTPSSSTFLRGDNTWATPAGGGDGAVLASQDTKPATDGSVDLWYETDGPAFYVYDSNATDFVEVGGGGGGGDLLAVNNLSDVASAATARVNLGVEIGVDVQAYSSVLAATTASFTTADESKLDGIEALADVTDESNVVAALSGAALTDAGTPASGDKILLLDVSDSDNLKVAQFSTFGGGGGGGATQSRPFASDVYATPPGRIGSGTVAQGMVRGGLYWYPFYVDADITVVTVATYVTTNVASNVCRIVIASGSSGVPAGALLYQSGDLDCSTTGLKEVTGLSVSLAPGFYFAGHINTGGSSNPSFQAVSGQLQGTGINSSNSFITLVTQFGVSLPVSDPYSGSVSSSSSQINCPVLMKWTVD